MDYPIRAESGKGRSAHIFNLNERAVAPGTGTGAGKGGGVGKTGGNA